MDFTLFGIGGAVLVGLIIQALKGIFPILGGSRWLIPLALGVGVILSTVAYLASIYPGFASWAEVVVVGLMAGFVAMGLYDSVHAARKR